MKESLNTLAIGAFRALGARDYGRIDMRLDNVGVPNFIEANLMPGLSDHGYLSRCFALNKSIAYEDMILSIVGLGLQRTQPAAADEEITVGIQLPEDLAVLHPITTGAVVR